jgi:hypothetical protein
MTVSTTLNKIIYPGTGAQTTFSFAFAFPGGTATQEAANIQVFFTDTLGNITQLTQGSGATQYQISFNPASSTNPTPTGGIVTYNPNAVPIALGTFLTIFRSLPLTQNTSIQNQSTTFQPIYESALDYEMMVSQQVLEVQSRALVVPVSDPTPGALPAVASRKNLFLAFDSSGNPIASSAGGSSVPISSAMTPVVSAATLAAGRSAFGLGNMAIENIGAGLQDDGSGNVRVAANIVGDTTPQSVNSGFHYQRRILFANVTYTLPLSSTLFNDFTFWITTSAFVATITPNAADAFSGMSTGQSLIIGPGQTICIYTNAVGSWFADFGVVPGNNAANNLQLNASVAASALTIALKDRNGNDPSATSPIIYNYSAGVGTITSRAIAAALSITVPSGATLGTVNGQANRIWVAVFDNSGSPVLGVYNSVTTGNAIYVVPWDETSGPATIAISAGSTLAQTWYTAGGALTGKPFKILGFVESTQPTAGAWTVTPSKIQLFGPGIRKPGDTVQEVTNFVTSGDTTNSATYVALTNNRIAITPISPCNVVRAEAAGQLQAPNSTAAGQTTSTNVQLSNGTTNNSGLFGSAGTTSLGLSGAGASQSSVVNPSYIFGYNFPNTISQVTYSVQGRSSGGTTTMNYGGSTMMAAREIQI